ncbi:hypothetical protein A1O3_10054 [Capronia epimyces CBS 606.96]|uniref:Aminoglycoside phosphotransferase domain-containing protein n=1 Tax=Capronia epimyces CBS 606.96 TaxID=1182542 RepID=W9X8W3_9EURO|nr:uncharacterized protein A1O3_10054 [Capronia epimyces CBS 606.96]EXJ76897.1 hypothetical protein A1O3_10054 [Capronia epimyces CBS 606.96]
METTETMEATGTMEATETKDTERLMPNELSTCDSFTCHSNPKSTTDQKCEFDDRLHQHRELIQELTAHHFGLHARMCHMAEQKEWIYDDYDVGIPVAIDPWEAEEQATKRVIVRFPLPYKVGELFRPGNADEKIRCEAGTTAWIQQNCPSVPIPRLHGFGLSTGQMFSSVKNLPFIHRTVQYLRSQVLASLGYGTPSGYVRHQGPSLVTLGSGYLVTDHIEETQSRCLRCPFMPYEDVPEERRRNLFQGISRVMLDLAQVSLPRIGSFSIDDKGFVSLVNRPLTFEIYDMENDKIPVDIPRDLTYDSVDAYVSDMLTCIHDSRLRHQTHGLILYECEQQMSTLAAMRAVSSLFFSA